MRKLHVYADELGDAGPFSEHSPIYSLSLLYEKVPYTFINIEHTGNEAFEAATRYKYTAKGVSETRSGNWWYYDADHNIVEVINA